MCVSVASIECHTLLEQQLQTTLQHALCTHTLSIGLYVSDIITLKVANMPEMMNFLTYTYFKINLLPNSIVLQHMTNSQCFQCLAGCGLYTVSQSMGHIICPLAGPLYFIFEECIKKGKVHFKYSYNKTKERH
jgi:hypothetical protein